MTQRRKPGGDAKKSPGKKADSPGSAKKSGVLISVADSHLERMPEVVDKLRAAGCDVHQILNAAGTITGAVDASKLGALKGVAGVASVEVEHSYQLPPPDSEIQ